MFGNRMFFLICSWRFLISKKLEQLEFKLEEIIRVWKHAGKVRKLFIPAYSRQNLYFQVALFLFREGRLSKKQIGVFIGGHHDFNQQVLSEIVMLHEFTHLILVQALRQFLWSFRYFHFFFF